MLINLTQKLTFEEELFKSESFRTNLQYEFSNLSEKFNETQAVSFDMFNVSLRNKFCLCYKFQILSKLQLTSQETKHFEEKYSTELHHRNEYIQNLEEQMNEKRSELVAVADALATTTAEHEIRILELQSRIDILLTEQKEQPSGRLAQFNQ